MRNRPLLTTPHSAKWIHVTIGLVVLAVIASGLYQKSRQNHKSELTASDISQKAFALSKAFTGYEAASADVNRIEGLVFSPNRQSRPTIWWEVACSTGSWNFDMLFNATTGRLRYMTGKHQSAGLQKLGPRIETAAKATTYGLCRLQEMGMIPLHAHAVPIEKPIELSTWNGWRVTYQVKRPDFPTSYIVRATISRQNGIPLFAEDMSEMILSEMH